MGCLTQGRLGGKVECKLDEEVGFERLDWLHQMKLEPKVGDGNLVQLTQGGLNGQVGGGQMGSGGSGRDLVHLRTVRRHNLPCGLQPGLGGGHSGGRPSFGWRSWDRHRILNWVPNLRSPDVLPSRLVITRPLFRQGRTYGCTWGHGAGESTGKIGDRGGNEVYGGGCIPLGAMLRLRAPRWGVRSVG